MTDYSQPAAIAEPDESYLLQRFHDEQRRFGKRMRPVSISFNLFFTLTFLSMHIWPLALVYLAVFGLNIVLLLADLQDKAWLGRLLAWFWLVLFLQSVISVFILGPSAGFQYFLIATIPPSFMSLHRPLRYKLLQGMVIAVFIMLCDELDDIRSNPLLLTDSQLDMLRYINSLGACALLGWVSHVRATMADEAEKALTHFASTDPLTGLFNRRAFIEIAERETARSLRKRQVVSLVLCDIDFFKRINDSRGHAAGDYVLQMVAELLRKELREYDVIARWGGEEFLILLSDADIVVAAGVAERVRAQVESTLFTFEEVLIPVSMTLGVSQVRTDENWRVALNHADAALYRGKAEGRNRVMLD